MVESVRYTVIDSRGCYIRHSKGFDYSKGKHDRWSTFDHARLFTRRKDAEDFVRWYPAKTLRVIEVRISADV